ncbi:MAG TPA: hypothetical protein VMW35_08765 [Myxococcota bacterium]|jgi:hypothetical protein|nr:hypothetical protein [Myxococcota bacterium]
MASSLRALVRQHPVITAVLVVSTVAGALAGPSVLPPEWSLARRMIGGALAGGGIGLLMTATKML